MSARLRPNLGQHFLRSRSVVSRLVELANIGSADFVVEIGPGRGAITAELARRAVRVLAVEIDPELATVLRAQYRSVPNVEVVTGDFLKHPPLPADHIVVGNIPFSQTAAIMRKIDSTDARSAWLIVQREAAERFTGQPWGPETMQSLLLKPRWHLEIRGLLGPQQFEPPPAVDSALLSLVRRAHPLVSRRPFKAFLRRSFGSGTTVSAGLRSTFTRRQLHRLSRDLHFSLEAVPSALTFDQWLALYRFAAHETLR